VSNPNGGSSWGTFAAVVGAIAALITAIVGIAALSGDGDDNDSGSAPAGRTLAEWADDANPICTRGAPDVAAASARITAEGSFEENIAGFRAIAVAIQRRDDRLRELPAPSEAEQDVERMIALSDEVASELTNAASAAERSDQATLATASDRALTQAERAGELASRLGVPRCRLEVAPATG
jgi:hypothetical protein